MMRAPAQIEPALKAILADLAARGIVTGDPMSMTIAEARRLNEAYFAAISEPRLQGVAVSVEHIATLAGPIAIKCAIKDGLSGTPVLIYAHGGGYAFGDLDTHDHLIRALAVETGMLVVAIHYRRSPEHVFPAPQEDTLALIAALRAGKVKAAEKANTSRLFGFGDSAGAHLILSVMLMLRDQGLPNLRGAALAYGMYARRYDTWAHQAYGDGSFGLSTARVRWFWDRFLDGAKGEKSIAEPLDADCKGLPPMALSAAECDCIIDDTLDFQAHLARQQHAHTLDIFPNATHGFLHLTSIYPGAINAIRQIAARLKSM
jgi:acetyl esterase